MGRRLFTDKLVCGWLEVLGVWSLDSATQAPAYLAHASGSPLDSATLYPAHAVARRHEVFKTDSDLDIFTVVSLYNTVYIWAGLIFLWACVSLVKNPKGQKDSSP